MIITIQYQYQPAVMRRKVSFHSSVRVCTWDRVRRREPSTWRSWPYWVNDLMELMKSKEWIRHAVFLHITPCGWYERRFPDELRGDCTGSYAVTVWRRKDRSWLFAIGRQSSHLFCMGKCRVPLLVAIKPRWKFTAHGRCSEIIWALVCAICLSLFSFFLLGQCHGPVRHRGMRGVFLMI